jgi:uncharacterized protein YuzE
MISTSYDPDADALSVWLAPPGRVSARTEEVAPGVLLDFDEAGELLGIEVLRVRARGTALATLPVPLRPAAE